jgi:hypothetical protein
MYSTATETLPKVAIPRRNIAARLTLKMGFLKSWKGKIGLGCVLSIKIQAIKEKKAIAKRRRM